MAFLFVLLLLWCESSAQKQSLGGRGSEGLDIHCGESEMRVTVGREFFRRRRTPFSPKFLRLGRNTTQTESCGPKEPGSSGEMVIFVRLRECGTESRVHGEWLVYSNQLFLLPGVVLTSTGSIIVRGVTTVIAVECYYERKRDIIGEPVKPTWMPMLSTIRGFGLLHFSLSVMTDECAALRGSLVFQQGETVFLEAKVDTPLHAPLTLFVDSCTATLKPDPLSTPRYSFITKHGCLMDSIISGSSSRFLPRERDDKLCFSVRAFRFTSTHVDQMFISCHLKAILKQDSHTPLDKACFFHRPSFSWQAAEGNSEMCKCCDSDCLTLPEEDNHVYKSLLPKEEKFVAEKTVGPLKTLERSYWTGRLSVNP